MNGRRTPVAPASEAPDGGAGWRAFALPRAAVVLVIVAAGIVLAATTGGTAAIVGWGVVAVGGTLAISFVFLGVGYSEDRARAREERSPTRGPRADPARARPRSGRASRCPRSR